MMMEHCVVPVIPTDYFRDMIYSTDFMNDDEFNGIQQMQNAYPAVGADQPNEDANMMMEHNQPPPDHPPETTGQLLDGDNVDIEEIAEETKNDVP